jgi:hypothetical protein
LVNGYRTALEEACIEYHDFIEKWTTVKDLLESVGGRFEEVYPTDRRDQENCSPISSQTHLEKLKSVNGHLTEKLTECRSALQQMKIPEEEIARARKSIVEARAYLSEHPNTTMPKELTDCLNKMEESVQAARKYSKQDLVSIVSNPESPNDIAELCQALKIQAYHQELKQALEDEAQRSQ